MNSKTPPQPLPNTVGLADAADKHTQLKAPQKGKTKSDQTLDKQSAVPQDTAKQKRRRSSQRKSPKISTEASANNEAVAEPGDGGRLSDENKRFIVELNACFRSPSEVVKAFREHFGFDILRSRVECYDPGKINGRNLSREYRELFEKARYDYLQRIQGIGITHRVYRMDRLNEMFDQTLSRGNIPLAKEILEHAAKEVGGVFSNTRAVGFPRGVEPEPKPKPPMTKEQATAAICEALASVLERTKSKPEKATAAGETTAAENPTSQ